MRLPARFLVSLLVLAVLLAVPAVAFAPPVPAVPLNAGGYYVYQDASGYWWIDGAAGNWTGGPSAPYNSFAVTPLTSCVVTIEYLDASDAVVGTAVHSVYAYVLAPYDVIESEYYSYYHVKLNLPAGAVPSKTRVADSSVEPYRCYGTPSPGAEPVRVSLNFGAPTADPQGRTTYSMTINNTSGYNLSSLMIVGSETYGPVPGNQYFLDTLKAAGPSWMGVGTTSDPIEVKGLAPTPGGMNRYGPQVWAEGKLMPDLMVWRFFNKKTGAHFYTADPNEKAYIITNLGWLYTLDGEAYADLQKYAPNNTSLWRLYNKKTGTHFYTADINEKHYLLATYPDVYSFDGEAYRVSMTPPVSPSGLTIHRFFNKKTGSHFYTADPNEKDNIIANLSSVYSYDGPAFYISMSGS